MTIRHSNQVWVVCKLQFQTSNANSKLPRLDFVMLEYQQLIAIQVWEIMSRKIQV